MKRQYDLRPEICVLIDRIALVNGVPKGRVIEEAVRHYAERCTLPEQVLDSIERMIDNFRNLPRY